MSLTDVLTTIQRLYMDSAPLIYYVEEHPTYLAKMDVVIAEVEQRPLMALSSVITLTEILTRPLKEQNKLLEQEYRDILLNSDTFNLLVVSSQIADSAADLRSRYNLRTPDALHVASALDANCDAFLTNDRGLKRIKEIKILVLDELA